MSELNEVLNGKEAYYAAMTCGLDKAHQAAKADDLEAVKRILKTVEDVTQDYRDKVDRVFKEVCL